MLLFLDIAHCPCRIHSMLPNNKLWKLQRNLKVPPVLWIWTQTFSRWYFESCKILQDSALLCSNLSITWRKNNMKWLVICIFVNNWRKIKISARIHENLTSGQICWDLRRAFLLSWRVATDNLEKKELKAWKDTLQICSYLVPFMLRCYNFTKYTFVPVVPRGGLSKKCICKASLESIHM